MKCKTRPTEPSMGSLAARRARARRRRLIDLAAESHEPTLLAGKRSSTSLLSAKDEKATLQETLHLLSIPGMRKSIRDAMAEPLSASVKELRW